MCSFPWFVDRGARRLRQILATLSRFDTCRQAVDGNKHATPVFKVKFSNITRSSSLFRDPPICQLRLKSGKSVWKYSLWRMACNCKFSLSSTTYTRGKCFLWMLFFFSEVSQIVEPFYNDWGTPEWLRDAPHSTWDWLHTDRERGHSFTKYNWQNWRTWPCNHTLLFNWVPCVSVYTVVYAIINLDDFRGKSIWRHSRLN